MFYIERKKRALAELKSAEATYKDIGTLANSKAISEQINLIHFSIELPRIIPRDTTNIGWYVSIRVKSEPTSIRNFS